MGQEIFDLFHSYEYYYLLYQRSAKGILSYRWTLCVSAAQNEIVRSRSSADMPVKLLRIM